MGKKKSKKAQLDENVVQEIVDLKKEHKLKIVDPDALVVRNILPGILTQVHCRVRGGRSTKKETVSSERGANGELIEKTLSTKIVLSEEENKAADAKRQKINRSVEKLGVKTAVGRIIPAHRKKELAEALAYGHALANKFNETSETCDLIFRYCLYNIEGNNSGTIAAVTEQLGDILERVNKSALADDAEILKHATNGQLGDWKTAADVMTRATADERRLIVAKVRAAMARAAISEARNFSTLLPEEAGLQVTEMVTTLKKTASSWVANAKKDDASYEEALKSYDASGVSAMQAALIKASVLADNKAEMDNEAEIAEMSGENLVLPMIDQDQDQDEPEPETGSDFVGVDLFKGDTDSQTI
jgi:hypothetical protein